MVSPGFSKLKKQEKRNRVLINWPKPKKPDVGLQNPKGNSTESDILPHEPEWVVSIRKKLAEARQIEASSSWGNLSIYRVPRSLRDPAHKKCYSTPQVVSLGPYHHGKSSVLKEMEEHKWRALDHILKRHDQDIKIYLDAMKELEEKARTCYERLGSFVSEEFVEMLVLDGCFMLELFRGADELQGFESLGYAKNDPVFSMNSTIIISIRRDMIMLENQIPLFVLDKLLSLQPGQSDQKSVARLALGFFDPLMPTEPLTSADPTSNGSCLHCLDVFRRSSLTKEGVHSVPPSTDPTSNGSCLHCLDVFRRSSLTKEGVHSVPPTDPTSDESGQLHCLDVFRRSLLKGFQRFHRPSPRDSNTVLGAKILQLLNCMMDERRQQLIPCVIDLKNAGVKFKKRETDQFLDIKFDKRIGVLEIPRILVHDGTKSLFFNLIAFEQCRMDSTDDITSYAFFLDNLINSAEDVSHLHYCGIIENCLGNDAEVAELFNALCQEVVFDNDDSSLSELSETINDYYKEWWHAWRADLRNKYFNNPWAIISLIAAVILLLLTFAQTFYGVYAYYRPSS
ncbi:hypothetical protein Dimus_014276 [Dionaea muscipula]